MSGVWILLISELLLYAGDKAFVSGSTYSLALLGLDEVENPDVTYNLVMTNTDDDGIDVTITDIGNTLSDPLSIPAGGLEEKLLTQAASMNGSGVDNKTIHVQSEGSFTLQVFAKRHDYIEGFLAIPKEDLVGPRQISGAYEFITTTFCATSGFCQIAVSAFEDNTGVSFKFPPESEEIVFCMGKDKGSFRSLRDEIVYLNRYQSIQFETAADLTGVRIYSFSPISVFVGSRNITQGKEIAHMVEQLHPSSQWGTQYVVHTLNDLGYGDLIRIASHWPNTVIDMKGFPVFVMTNWTQNVWRRLDKGMSSFITASKPIQVVQVTGLMYATEGETTMAAMTVVPAIENGDKVFTVSCGQSSTYDEIHFVSDKRQIQSAGTYTDAHGEPPVVVNGEGVAIAEEIDYTMYGVGNVTASADVYIIKGTEDVTGIVKCKGTAVMPMGLRHKNLTGREGSDLGSSCDEDDGDGDNYEDGNDDNDNDDKDDNGDDNYNDDEDNDVDYVTVTSLRSSTIPYIMSIVKMLRGSSSFNPQESETAKHHQINSGETLIKRHQITFGEFKILQLRTRSCGRLNIQFLENATTIGNRLLFVFTKNMIFGHRCYPECNGTFSMNTSIYNEDYNCTTDMLFYWFRLLEEGGAKKLCYGTGPFADRTSCENGIDIPEFFVRALLLATPGDAEYNYDLETEESCDYRESEWRCEDKSPICEKYGPNICTAEADYARTHCAKFCQHCTPDSYGRKFIVVTPNRYILQNCYIHVTGYMTTPNVAVSTKTKLLTVKQDYSQDRTRVYSCPSDFHAPDPAPDPVTVIADADVTVSVLYRVKDGTAVVMSYPVYPVDSYGSEYIVFAESASLSLLYCEFISEHHNIAVQPHEVFYSYGNNLFEFGYDNGQRIYLGHFPKGLFVSEKPFAVICVHDLQMTSYQLVPTSSWGTRYLVPEFDPDLAGFPFDISLKIITNRDNTVVNIDGDFNAVYPLYKRGDEVVQEITGAATYTVTATHPIAVAVVFKDQRQPNFRTLHVLPPSDDFLGAQVNAIPAFVLHKLYSMNALSAVTYFVTSHGASGKREHTDMEELWVTDNQTAGQVGLSVIRSENSWITLSGPRTFKTDSPASLCHTSLPATPGDNIDNDCDGLIDEDTSFSGYAVYGNDFDLDGMFNDDSCCQDKTTAILEKPTDPKCLEIMKPANQCWVVWSGCNCEWLWSLENYKKMTEEEKATLHTRVARQQKARLTVDQNTLSATTAQKESASDERQSAASIGYVGIALFACVFGTIFFMDIQSVIRDIRITFRNICDGVDKLKNFFKRCKRNCEKLRGYMHTEKDVREEPT